MKLKGLGNRAYNIMFHAHTVSGIVISFALYVIFFAGAFTIFKDEFYRWENPEARIPVVENVDYDHILTAIKKLNPDFQTEKDIFIRAASEENPLIVTSGRVVKKNKAPEYISYTINPATEQIKLNEPEATAIGETLYRLHFLDQLPILGRYLAGFVALFFLFATITGVLIHWRNIITKFYGFTIKGAWKQIWTNAHTVFGLIGLPFQMMYAITGAYYLLTILILAPTVLVLYGGDQQKILAVVRPYEGIQLDAKSPVNAENLSLATLASKIKSENPAYRVTMIGVENYGKEDGIMTARIVNDRYFTGDGFITLRLKDGKKIAESIPGRKKYVESVLDAFARLHFALFGGLLLKGLYFILALLTCLVIISGILIWKEARNKKSYTLKQKRFHHRVTMWYLSICFGLFPAVAILFSAELLVPADLPDHTSLVNTVFFVSWLILLLIGIVSKTEHILTRNFLLLTGLFGLMVPIVNGVKTGDWIWKTIAERQFYVAGTDIFWLVTGLLTLFLFSGMKNKTAVITQKVAQEVAQNRHIGKNYFLSAQSTEFSKRGRKQAVLITFQTTGGRAQTSITLHLSKNTLQFYERGSSQNDTSGVANHHWRTRANGAPFDRHCHGRLYQLQTTCRCGTRNQHDEHPFCDRHRDDHIRFTNGFVVSWQA